MMSGESVDLDLPDGRGAHGEGTIVMGGNALAAFLRRRGLVPRPEPTPGVTPLERRARERALARRKGR